MSSKATKFCVAGVWYRRNRVLNAACSAANISSEDVEDDEDLSQLVEALAKGDPSSYAKFIVALNEYLSTK